MEQQSKIDWVRSVANNYFFFIIEITGHSNAPTILSLTSDILFEKFASNLGLQCPSTNGDSVRRRLKKFFDEKKKNGKAKKKNSPNKCKSGFQ